MSYIPTVGPTGGVKNRLDVVNFVKDEKFFTLYVRALKTIQDLDQEEYTSYFQLAGIHGLPLVHWAKKQDTLVTYKSGYCTHGSVLFPTWHRVYASIHEQVIQQAAIETAAKFTHDKEAWAQAAQDLRQPYWDWGFQLIPPGELLTETEVEIVDYNGTKIKVANPLLCYHFHPVDPSFETSDPHFQLRNSPVTARYPDANMKEDILALVNKFEFNAEIIRDKTYKMLKDNDSWGLFSNHGVFGEAHANSLEAVHDDIHILVGYSKTRGHMAHPFWAAFDPIFWFHHANIDRLLSLWQAMNPGVWVSEGKTTEESFLFPGDVVVGVNTPLEPFYKTTDQVWTSAPLQDTQQFGYSYPDFDDVVGRDPQHIRYTIRDLINRRYGTEKSKGASNAALDLLSAFQGVTRGHSEDLRMFDWSIHATFNKFELKESFSLIFYFADNDGDYSKKESYVGCINAFRGTTPETCTNCKKNEALVQEGFVHLNRILAESIQSFDPADVLKFLNEKKLSYKLFTDEAKTLSSLKLRVEGRPLHIPPGLDFPKVDKSKELVVATDIIQHMPLALNTVTRAVPLVSGAVMGKLPRTGF